MERERIDKEATEAALRQMAELDEQLQVREVLLNPVVIGWIDI